MHNDTTANTTKPNKIIFLGSGTSTGVPQIGCHCPTCSSTDPRDNRLRASVLVSYQGKNILIDCGPDFRYQMLRAGSPSLDALLITHVHYDHVGGLDDLRPYSIQSEFPVYCRADVSRNLHERLPYCFGVGLKPGIPHYDMHIVDDYTPFEVGHLKVTPLPVMHARLPILGYRIGRMAYITDCKVMPEATLQLLDGVDTLIINALRPKPHISHLSLGEALDIIEKVNPRVAWLTHMSHDMPTHARAQKLLPSNVNLAYDGLEITF